MRRLEELSHVADDQLPAAVFGKEAEIGFIVDALTVTQMVVPDDQEAVFGEESGKIVVALNMLRDAVRDLDDAEDPADRRTAADMDLRLAVAGQK